MRALVTGASSGIGLSMAKYLDKLGYDLVLITRDKKKLDNVSFNNKVDIYCTDVGKVEKCIDIYNKYPDMDVVINNAGFGLFGEFALTDLDKEMNMIDVNIKAVHVLTKLYLKNMIKRDSGHILNVGSIAGFMPGPLLDTYYASKNYVVRLSQSIKEELRRRKSKVGIHVLCPGPVKTNFDNVAGVSFSLKGMDSDYVAKYAIDKMLLGKVVIIPSFTIKMLRIVTKVFPDSLVVKMVYNSQRRKGKI